MKLRLVLLFGIVLGLTACGGNGPAKATTPTAPTNVTATPGPGYITVSWQDNSDNETGFIIYRDSAGAQMRSQALEKVGEVGANTEAFVDRTIAIGQGYQYSVTAKGSQGESAQARAPTTAEVTVGVDLIVGTYNLPYFTEKQTVLGFYFAFPDDAVPAEGINLTITGPNGWNGGTPFEDAAPPIVVERGFGWVSVFTPAMSGTYQLSASAGDSTYTASASLDATRTLPYTDQVSVTSSSPSEVAASWDAVTGAASYEATVFSAPVGPGVPGFGGQITQGTSTTITGLDLEPGNYVVGVNAWTLDRMVEGPPVKPDTFLMSFNASDAFTIEGNTQACTNSNEVISIPDANLEGAIKETLSKASGDLTCADMASLTELEANGRDLGSLEGLQHAVNLTSLDLRDNTVTNISPLLGLAKLEELYLNRNPIASISGLGNLTSLTDLGLESLGLDNADLAGLAGLTKLEFLGLEDNDISDISVVSGLTNLLHFEFQDNEVADISALANLTKLRALFMERNRVGDVSALAGLSDLVALIASENNISDLSPLANLTNMQYFYVSDNPVGSIDVVANYVGLLELGAGRIGVTDLSPIAGKPLTYLWLNGNENLADFSAIGPITTLEVLLAGGTGFGDDDMPLLANKTALTRLQLWADEGVSDLSVLSGLNLIEELNIGGTGVSELAAIHHLSDLKRLHLYYLGLDNADIAFLSDFTQLEQLSLAGNEIDDISVLIANSGIGEGDEVDISNNLLELAPGTQDRQNIQALLDRGVDLTFEPQKP